MPKEGLQGSFSVNFDRKSAAMALIAGIAAILSLTVPASAAEALPGATMSHGGDDLVCATVRADAAGPASLFGLAASARSCALGERR